jgi:hypothetical protein
VLASARVVPSISTMNAGTERLKNLGRKVRCRLESTEKPATREERHL